MSNLICPNCNGKKVYTERRPDGDSWCEDCNFKSITLDFKKEGVEESTLVIETKFGYTMYSCGHKVNNLPIHRYEVKVDECGYCNSAAKRNLL